MKKTTQINCRQHHFQNPEIKQSEALTEIKKEQLQFLKGTKRRVRIPRSVLLYHRSI